MSFDPLSLSPQLQVWVPYRRLILLLHISNSRKMVLLHEAKASQGAAGFNTKFANTGLRR